MVEGLAHPLCFERRAVRKLVPARVAGTIDRTVDKKRRDRPPRAPRVERHAPRRKQQRDPQAKVPQAFGVAALHQLLECLARNVGVIPVLLVKCGPSVALD